MLSNTPCICEMFNCCLSLCVCAHTCTNSTMSDIYHQHCDHQVMLCVRLETIQQQYYHYHIHSNNALPMYIPPRNNYRGVSVLQVYSVFALLLAFSIRTFSVCQASHVCDVYWTLVAMVECVKWNAIASWVTCKFAIVESEYMLCVCVCVCVCVLTRRTRSPLLVLVARRRQILSHFQCASSLD
jgi:hypothetical protein